MKSFRNISSAWLILFASQTGICFGDSFFDFGLQWTQWIPSRGEVQTFASESTPTVIPVPLPKQAWRTVSALDDLPETRRPINTPSTVSSDSYIQAAQPVDTSRTKNFTNNTIPSTYNNPVPVAPSNYSPQSPTQPPAIFTPVTNVTPLPAATAQPVTIPASSPLSSSLSGMGTGNRFDALIRMDGGPFPGSSQLLTGQSQAWYQSPVVQSLYGGTPNADQQRSFEQDVLQKVTQTYAQSGVNVNLTLDPNVSAAHTISVVSGASYGALQEAAGITAMNGDGFSFIDKLNGAGSINDLEWAVAHNVAHELLHAFDVPHHDTTGQYLDAAVANWDLMLDPNTKFSAAAVTDLQSKLSGVTNSYASAPDTYGFFGQELAGSTSMAQIVQPQPVPEPATIAIWTIAAGLAYVVRRQRKA